MSAFNFNNEVTLISHYCNSHIAVYDPVENNPDEIDWNKNLKNYKLKKSKNGASFNTGGDQHMMSHLYVSKFGKVEKIFIDLTMHFPEAFDDYGAIKLLYNDQFLSRLSSLQKFALETNKTSVKFRRQIANIEIVSGFIKIGQHPVYSSENSTKYNDSELLIFQKKDKIKIQTDNTNLDNFMLPLKNKKYPIYIYSYLAPDEDNIAGAINEKKLIVIENIDGCYIDKLTKKSITLKRTKS